MFILGGELEVKKVFLLMTCSRMQMSRSSSQGISPWCLEGRDFPQKVRQSLPDNAKGGPTWRPVKHSVLGKCFRYGPEGMGFYIDEANRISDIQVALPRQCIDPHHHPLVCEEKMPDRQTASLLVPHPSWQLILLLFHSFNTVFTICPAQHCLLIGHPGVTFWWQKVLHVKCFHIFWFVVWYSILQGCRQFLLTMHKSCLLLESSPRRHVCSVQVSTCVLSIEGEGDILLSLLN